MRCTRSVLRVVGTLGILAITFASVAQAKGVDRKAYQNDRNKRVKTGASTGDPTSSASQRSYIRTLVATEFRSLATENSLIAAEDRLVAAQNAVINLLSRTSNPFVTRILDAEGLVLQGEINHDLTRLDAIENVVNTTLTTLEQYAGPGSGFASIVSSIAKTVAADAAKIAAIAARPPFTIPPATPGI